MAARYWVGGTANWDSTTGIKWATTSGGEGGASVPTSADDVFLDAASGTVTVTISTSRQCLSLNCTGFTGALTGGTNTLTASGNVTYAAGMTLGTSLTLAFNAPATLTTNGKTVGSVTVNTGGALTLGGNVTGTSSSVLTVNAGSLDTNNFSVSMGALSSSNSTTRTITLGSSNITLASMSPLVFTTTTNLTLNTGTSTITTTDSNATLALGSTGLVFNTILMSAGGGGAAGTINGTASINALTITMGTSKQATPMYIGGNLTIGTLTVSGTTVFVRLWLQSSVPATPRTLTVTTLSANDCDFEDITIAGAAAGSSPTRAGDGSGNSGITFPAAKTVYRVGGSPSWEVTNSWATASGGTGNDANFPLAQDTAIYDNNSPSSVGFMGYLVKTFDCTPRTTAMSITSANSLVVYKDFKLRPSTSSSSSIGLRFRGTGAKTFLCNGNTLSFGFDMQGTGALTLSDNFISTGSVTVTRGTLNANNFNVTCWNVDTNNSNTRTILMGSGTWTLSGSSGTLWNSATTSGLVVTTGTSTILLTGTGTSSRTFSGGLGVVYNNLTIGGASGVFALNVNNGSTFNSIASSKTGAFSILFAAGTTTTVTNWAVSGTSGNVVTIGSQTASNHTLTKSGGGTVSAEYLSISRSTATPATTWYATSSTDAGNNSGWTITSTILSGNTISFGGGF